MTGERSIRPEKLIGWSGIIAALVFFFNPDAGVLDIFPDFFGYILLCAAIKRIADIDERINEARELFRRMLYISLVKFVLLFFQLGFIPSTDQSLSTLMFTFIYSVLEIMTVIPAVIKLFDGILYLSSRNEGEAAYLPAKKSGSGEKYEKTVTERARNITVAFVIIKAVLRTLPEFAALSEQSYAEGAIGQLYQFTNILRFFGIAIVLIAAVCWIIPMFRYIKLIKRDNKLMQNLSLIYNRDILSKTDRFAKRAVFTAFGYFGASAVLTLDFYIDNFNILPDILSALCAVAGMLILRKFIKGWKIGILTAGVYGVVSLAAMIVEYRFNVSYYAGEIMKNEEAFDAFVGVCIMSALASIAFIVFAAVLFLKIIKDIIYKHTGFSMTSSDTYDPTEKIRLLHASLEFKMLLPMIFAVLASLVSVISELLINTVDFMWMIEFLLSGLFAYSFIKLLVEINEQISYKYMLSE